MTVVVSAPTSAGRRHQVRVVHTHLHKEQPYRPLLKKMPNHAGRNNQGRVTVKHRGGGHKRRYRIIDFKRDKIGIEACVERIEYDPNRTSHIALVLYKDGERRYIIAPKSLSVGDKIVSDDNVAIQVGNCLPMRDIPYGTSICCIELKPGKGAQIARSAGAYAQLLSREGAYAIIRLRSGEVRKVLSTCRACIGEVSNGEHSLQALGKAGASRHRGRRPHVRGVAMNPVDHPLGGGEGKTSGGRHPVNAKGLPTKGYKTRRRKKWTNKMIVRDRRRKNK